MALGVVARAIALPMFPVGRRFGFVPSPPLFAFVIGTTIAYLTIVEVGVLSGVAVVGADPMRGIAPKAAARRGMWFYR
jgi:hypothetical protein